MNQRAIASMLEDNNINRFRARREAERRRGVTFHERSGRTASTPQPQTPWLLATVVGSLGVLFVLAVVGAYALIRAVLGSE